MSTKIRIFGRVTYDRSGPVDNAEVCLIRIDGDTGERLIRRYRANAGGLFDFEDDCDEGAHIVRARRSVNRTNVGSLWNRIARSTRCISTSISSSG